MKSLWIKLSDDEYLLPEMVADSAYKLSKMCGVKQKTIQGSWRRYKNGTLYHRPRFIKVEVDDDE